MKITFDELKPSLHISEAQIGKHIIFAVQPATQFIAMLMRHGNADTVEFVQIGKAITITSPMSSVPKVCEHLRKRFPNMEFHAFDNWHEAFQWCLDNVGFVK